MSDEPEQTEPTEPTEPTEQAEGEAPVEAKAKPAKAAKAKAAKGKKGKDKGKKGAEKGAATVSLKSHPRASAHLRTLKGWGGLIGFLLTAYLSWKADVPLATLCLRAMLAGVAGYIVAWWCGVVAWRAIVLAEMRARFEEHIAEDPRYAGRLRR